MSSVCEQRCISVDTPRHSCVPGNLGEVREAAFGYFLISFQMIVQKASGYTEDVQSSPSCDKGIINCTSGRSLRCGRQRGMYVCILVKIFMAKGQEQCVAAA